MGPQVHASFNAAIKNANLNVKVGIQIDHELFVGAVVHLEDPQDIIAVAALPAVSNFWPNRIINASAPVGLPTVVSKSDATDDGFSTHLMVSCRFDCDLDSVTALIPACFVADWYRHSPQSRLSGKRNVCRNH